MALLKEYHRPQSVQEAVQLLARQDVRLAPLAGGSQLVGQLETRAVKDVDGVVDLGHLGLNFITAEEDRLRLGATTPLADVMDHPVAGQLADGLLRRTGRYEGPVNLRNMATLGGLVATAEPDSELYAALLALDAQVVWSDGTSQEVIPLKEWRLAGRGPGLIVELQIPVQALNGGHARVARTPSDRCIVAAVAVVGPELERVALCGVASRPILGGEPLDPPDDFKGSAEYRSQMAQVLTERALQEARKRASSGG